MILAKSTITITAFFRRDSDATTNGGLREWFVFVLDEILGPADVVAAFLLPSPVKATSVTMGISRRHPGRFRGL